MQTNANTKGIRFLRNFGKSQALHAGFAAAQGEVVFTMDADLQDSPDELPAMYHHLKQEKLDILSGWKKKRYDSILFKIFLQSFLIGPLEKVQEYLHDFNCGKGLPKEVVKVSRNMEKCTDIFLLSQRMVFKAIKEQVVQHQARKYGQTKFGLNRFINGFLG